MTKLYKVQEQRSKWMDIFRIFSRFSPTVFAFASAGSALQALGAAERAGDEAPKPA